MKIDLQSNTRMCPKNNKIELEIEPNVKIDDSHKNLIQEFDSKNQMPHKDNIIPNKRLENECFIKKLYLIKIFKVDF